MQRVPQGSDNIYALLSAETVKHTSYSPLDRGPQLHEAGLNDKPGCPGLRSGTQTVKIMCNVFGGKRTEQAKVDLQMSDIS